MSSGKRGSLRRSVDTEQGAEKNGGSGSDIGGASGLSGTSGTPGRLKRHGLPILKNGVVSIQ